MDDTEGMAAPGSDALTRQLAELVEDPRESLSVEVKRWLDLADVAVRADLAQELLALANHGGGYLIFGFDDDPTGLSSSGACPYPADQYSQDAINGAVVRYADPPFHCAVHRVPAASGVEHVVVVVPGGHKVPIRSKRDGPPGAGIRQNTYYIRKPLPESAPISAAHEWDELIGRCIQAKTDDLLDSFRRIVNALRPSDGLAAVVEAVQPPGQDDRLPAWEQGGHGRLETLIAEHLPDESPSRYAHGTWTASYQIEGIVSPPSLSSFLDVLAQAAGHETGWPPWWVPTRDGIRPYPFDDLIECWLAEGTLAGPAHSDFWRADPHGRMFLLRGYQEDSSKNIVPGTLFDLTLPVWRVGECLLHARRLARTLHAEDCDIEFMMRWQGLDGRELAVVASPNRDLMPGRRIQQDEVLARTTTDTAEIDDALPEVVRRLVEPLYSRFAFFEPPPALYAEEIARMRSRGE